MLNDISNNFRYPCRVIQCFFRINSLYLLIDNVITLSYGIHIIYPERKDIAVIDGINNSICM